MLGMFPCPVQLEGVMLNNLSLHLILISTVVDMCGSTDYLTKLLEARLSRSSLPQTIAKPVIEHFPNIRILFTYQGRAFNDGICLC